MFQPYIPTTFEPQNQGLADFCRRENVDPPQVTPPKSHRIRNRLAIAFGLFFLAAGAAAAAAAVV